MAFSKVRLKIVPKNEVFEEERSPIDIPCTVDTLNKKLTHPVRDKYSIVHGLESLMRKKTKSPWWGPLLIMVLLPVLIPLLTIALVAFVGTKIFIYLLVWTCWSPRGINLLYVYSDSPNWQNKIEQEILPRLPSKSIVLNWSERRFWKRWSLATLVFYHFGGYRSFNPLGVIIRPLRRARVFRFYEVYQDFKHGRPEPLQRMEVEFFAALKHP
jgi:hypothetical protein